MERKWIFVVRSDTVDSTLASNEVRDRHFSIAEIAIKESGAHFSVKRIEGDQILALFADPLEAINSALRVHARTRVLNDHLMERIGIDAGSIINGSLENIEELKEDPLYDTKSRVSRIMELCPDGYTLCSHDVLRQIDEKQSGPLHPQGPLFAKLKGFPRPIPLYFVGNMPSDMIDVWQSKRIGPGWGGILGAIMAGHYSEFAASILAMPLWLFSRNNGLYKLGKLWFKVIRTISRLFRWQRLELHSAIGLGDVTMLLWRFDESLMWVKQTSELANKFDDNFYQIMSGYQLGHVLAHQKPTTQAETLLWKSYRSFEKLGDQRMAGWSAMYLGRCLRGRKQFKEAEDWLLASFVVIASAGRHRRQMAYALIQMARLRYDQGCISESDWYLDKATQIYPKAVRCAPDDSPWDSKLKVIQKEASAKPAEINSYVDDPVRQLVSFALDLLHRRRL